jgi:hypothetical protein
LPLERFSGVPIELKIEGKSREGKTVTNYRGVRSPRMLPPPVPRDPMHSMHMADEAMKMAEQARKDGFVAEATMYYAKATALYGQANYYWITG